MAITLQRSLPLTTASWLLQLTGSFGAADFSSAQLLGNGQQAQIQLQLGNFRTEVGGTRKNLTTFFKKKLVAFLALFNWYMRWQPCAQGDHSWPPSPWAQQMLSISGCWMREGENQKTTTLSLSANAEKNHHSEYMIHPHGGCKTIHSNGGAPERLVVGNNSFFCTFFHLMKYLK